VATPSAGLPLWGAPKTVLEVVHEFAEEIPFLGPVRSGDGPVEDFSGRDIQPLPAPVAAYQGDVAIDAPKYRVATNGVYHDEDLLPVPGDVIESDGHSR